MTPPTERWRKIAESLDSIADIITAARSDEWAGDHAPWCPDECPQQSGTCRDCLMQWLCEPAPDAKTI